MMSYLEGSSLLSRPAGSGEPTGVEKGDEPLVVRGLQAACGPTVKFLPTHISHFSAELA